MSSTHRTRPRWPIILLVVIGASIAVGLLALGPDHGVAPALLSTASPSAAVASVTPVPTAVPMAVQTPSPPLASAAPSSIEALLARLVIAPEHRGGYDRDLFPLWTDEDGDGCNTRYEVLIAQAVTPPDVTGSCHLTGGSWRSPYDGLVIDRADGVQIDHLVALAEAWYSGAYAWTTADRERYANDLGVPWALVAVSPDVNEAKGSSDPAEWLPPNASAVCPYIDAWIAEKVRWGLTVDPREHRALADLVGRCPAVAMDVPLARVSTP